MPVELSVVMPSFNKGAHLANALLSLSIQTLPADQFEVLIVDDGSQDQTRRVVEEARKSYRYRLRYWYLNRPAYESQALAFNVGAKRAEAPYLLHMSPDIILAKDALALHLAYQQDSDQNVFVFGQCYMIHSRMAQARLPYIPWQQDMVALEGSFITPFHHSAYWRTPMHASLPKVWVEQLHGYDESYHGLWADDMDFWVRAEAAGVQAINPPDVWGAHQWHIHRDHVCYRGCSCPLWQKSGAWSYPGARYDGLPEDLVRNGDTWGEFADMYEG